MKKLSAITFHSLSFYCVAIVAGLLPLVFLPNGLAATTAVKGIVLYGGVFLALALWLIAQFLNGSIEIPRHRVLLGLCVWTVLTLLTALFSQNVNVSLWGRGFAIDSFATTFVLSVLTFLVATYTTEQRRLVQFFLILFASAALTILLQIILFAIHGTSFATNALSLVSSSGSVTGSWIDFGQYIVLIFLLSLLTFEVLSPRGFLKGASLSVVVISLIVLAFLNSLFLWLILLGATMLIFVYKSSVERVLANSTQDPAVEHVPFPWLTFASLLVGLFFILSSNSFGGSLARFANINTQNIRPSISTTGSIIAHSFIKDPIFGTGPGRFDSAWNAFHPPSINNTVFWNTPFENGYSSLMTHQVSRGTITTLALLATFFFALLYGFKLFAYHFKDQFGRFLATTTLILLITCITFFLFSTPNLIIISFLFIYLGVFIGLGVSVGVNRFYTIRFLQDPRQSFFAIFVLAVCILASVSATYVSAKRFAGIIYFNRALTATNTDIALRRLASANAFSSNDLYLRAQSSIHILIFNTEINRQNADKVKLQNSFTAAEQSASAAAAWDPTNPTNWFTLGQIYQLVIGSSPEAYTNAVSAYDRAIALAPQNPLFILSKSQLALSQKETTVAEALIDEAIALKSNYLEAYLLRAQIKQAAGDSTGARDIIRTYTANVPYDAQGFAVLGIAERNLKNYNDALDAFKQARQLSPETLDYSVLIIQTLYSKGEVDLAEAEKKIVAEIFPNQKEAIESIRPVITPTPLPDPEISNPVSKQ